MGSQVTGTQPLLLEAESLTEVSRLGLGPSKTSGQNPSPKSTSIFHPFFLCCKYFSQDTGCHDFLALLDVSSGPTGAPKAFGALRFLSSWVWLPGGLGWRTALGTILGSPQMSPSCE